MAEARTGAGQTQRAKPRWDWRYYNRHDVLRVRWPFWLVMLYELRHLLLIFIIGLSHGRGAGDDAGNLASLVDAWFVAADGPALLLLFATGSRVPAGGAAARFVWRHGRALLLAGIALFAGILAWRNGPDLAAWSWAERGELALNLALALYVWRSAWLRDLFAQFPDPPPPKPAR